ncbi:MAG: NUDIX hydrolase [Sphaerochaetaceae bacterium]|nr:NUDIX hydrolase [Sphaerochaetaceae bacterium]
MSNKIEYWDIYDINKNKTGRKMLRNDWTMADGDYYLSVLGVIKRPDGSYLITQRSMDKAWAAGWWEVPGGGVMSGETSLEAVIREVREETGLDVSSAKGGYQFCYHRENKGQNYIVDIYRFELDVDESELKLQKDETLGGKFATLSEIKELAQKGIFLHYDSIKKVFK